MPDPSVLILDDDEMWLARHERRLREAGFKCRSTQRAEEAIDIARTDPSIKFALIDEILFVPPIPVEEGKRELQRWQGSGVVRKIIALRADVQIIMVTSAPLSWSSGDTGVLIRETSKLRRQRGVIDVIHKHAIEEDPDYAYGWLTELLSKPQLSTTGQVVMPRILVGLGFQRELYEAMTEQVESPKAKWLPLRAVLEKLYQNPEISLEHAIDEFLEGAQARETTVFVEMPGSKKLDRCSNIKPDSSELRVLMTLARRAEKRDDMVIREEDYQYSPRRSGRVAHAIPDVDPKSVEDFAFGYDEDNRKRLRKGVHIEQHSGRNSPLKVAIHRLSQKLAGLNVGPARRLFENVGPGTYRPCFKIGMILYPTGLAQGRRRSVRR